MDDHLYRLLFTPTDVLVRGLRYLSGVENISASEREKKHSDIFKKHYGLDETRISFMWFDIITKNDLGIKRSEKSEKGF